MPRLIRFVSPVVACLAASALSGCAFEKEDASEFREAVPSAGSVDVDGPAASAGTSEKRGTLAVTGPASEPARWYTFTRDVRDGVNLVTGSVLAAVWLVVHIEPNEIDEEHAVWGPYDGDALDPVRYRFTVTRNGDHHFVYRLEGQAKAGAAGAPFLTVLEGDGYSRRSQLHGDGSFVIDLEHARSLDPGRHQGDSGSVTITHDLPFGIGRRRDALPRTIVASLRPSDGQQLDITSTAREDHTGELALIGLADVDASNTSALEDVSITSRWQATGAGRADVLITGGDLPASGFESAALVECWGTNFSRVYYSDSVGLEDTEGSAADCAYADPAP